MVLIKRHFKPFLMTAIFAVIPALIYSFQYQFDPAYGDSISYTLKSFCFYESNDDLMLTLTISATMFIQIIPLLNIFKRDFGTELWYCITRYHSRKRWFFKKTATVILMSLFSAVVFFAVSLILLLLRNVVDSGFVSENKTLFLWLFLLRFFFVVFFALLLNVISIAVKVRYIVALGAALTIASGAFSIAEIFAGLKNSLNSYVHATFYFHREITAFLDESRISYFFSGISLFESAIYFVACLGIITTAGLILTEKMDLGLLEEY